MHDYCRDRRAPQTVTAFDDTKTSSRTLSRKFLLTLTRRRLGGSIAAVGEASLASPLTQVPGPAPRRDGPGGAEALMIAKLR
jgi:hypothetical protein